MTLHHAHCEILATTTYGKQKVTFIKRVVTQEFIKKRKTTTKYHSILPLAKHIVRTQYIKLNGIFKNILFKVL